MKKARAMSVFIYGEEPGLSIALFLDMRETSHGYVNLRVLGTLPDRADITQVRQTIDAAHLGASPLGDGVAHACVMIVVGRPRVEGNVLRSTAEVLNKWCDESHFAIVLSWLGRAETPGEPLPETCAPACRTRKHSTYGRDFPRAGLSVDMWREIYDLALKGNGAC
jgi:hypothetical protein